MRKIRFNIKTQNEKPNMVLEFITDRTPEWTEEQYTRNREPLTMELISNETTEETEPLSREV